MFHFYTPGKRQKTFGLLTFSRGIEMEHWAEMDLIETQWYQQMSEKQTVLLQLE